MWTRRQAIENMNYWSDSRTIEGMMNRAEGFKDGQPNWSWIVDQVMEADEECWHPSLENLTQEEYDEQSEIVNEEWMAYFLDLLRIKFPVYFASIPSLENLLAADTLEWPVCTFSFEWAICSGCRGNGTHVNPSIDCGGITQDEFDEDPEFAESYFRGDYDVSCKPCGGSGKVKVMSEHNNKFVNWILELVEEHDRFEYEYAQEVAAERRMGC